MDNNDSVRRLIDMYVEAAQDVITCIVQVSAGTEILTKHDVDDAFGRMVALYEELRDAVRDVPRLTGAKN